MERVCHYKRLGLSARLTLLMGAVLIVTLLLTVGLPVGLFAQDGNDTQKEEPRDNIINIHGSVVGSVDTKGNVTNKFGSVIGSVDGDGSIFNVSGIDIGKVTPDGKVMNQSGTVLGSVRNDGSVYNVSGRKVGQVKELEDIKIIGGAARLLFLK